MFIYILKIETHTARATSVCLIGTVTIITLVRYLSFVKLEAYHVVIVIIAGASFGIVGSKLMRKMQQDYLNLISGVIVTGFAIYSLVKK